MIGPERPNFNPEFSMPAEQEPIKSKQEVMWEKKLADVEQIADRLGKGVDEKMKEPVAAFLLHDFTTSASCEGHLAEEGEEEHGLPYPWVEIYAPEPAGWRDTKEGEKKTKLEREWMMKNFEQQQKMIGFLEKFYQGRETPFDARLSFDRVGAFGGFRVQSFGAEMMKLLPPKEQLKKLEIYRKEMNDFTEFLRYSLKNSAFDNF